MTQIEDIRFWRAKEIAKLLLLKSTYTISIDETDQVLFDLVISIKNGEVVKFGVMVVLTDRRDRRLKEDLKNVYTLSRTDMPILLMIIDEKKETGEIGYLIAPRDQQLVLQDYLHSQPITSQKVDQYIREILVWSAKQGKKIA